MFISSGSEEVTGDFHIVVKMKTKKFREVGLNCNFLLLFFSSTHKLVTKGKKTTFRIEMLQIHDII